MKGRKIPRDCQLKGTDVHRAMLGIARMHNLVLSEWQRNVLIRLPGQRPLRDTP